MELASLTTGQYTPAFGAAGTPQPPPVAEGPAGSVASAGDEQTRGVAASEKQAGAGERDDAASREEAASDATEERELEELQARDREVRAHEQAHMAAAGRYATHGAAFDYTRGPDGRQYATGGEVSISTSEVAGDPEATLRKMEQVRRAALAPTEPSAQDLRVAADASAAATRARQEIAREARDENRQDASRAYGDTAALQSGEAGSIDLMA